MKKILIALLIHTCSLASIFAQPVADFSGNPTTLCAGKSVSWINLSTGITDSTHFVWSFPGSTNLTDVNRNPAPVQYNVPGTYSVSLTVSNNNGTDTKIKTNYISVLPLPVITVTPPAGYVGCNITSVTLTVQGANKYLWAPTTNLSVAPGGLAIASPPTNVIYTVMGMDASGCISQQKEVPVYFNTSPPPPAGAITGGQTTVCAGQTVGTYSVPSTGPVSPYRTWTVPPGSVIASGQGTENVKITFGNISGDICCTASNACGSATPTCEAITVNPTPAVGSPGTITGPATACANTGVIYTIAPVANALAYNWTATGGATITAGQGTNTITVVFSTNNSNVCVTASNSCNISEPSCRNITVFSAAPAIPGTITGPTAVCNMQSGVNYSIANVPNATVYTWAVPAGASIASGQGTRAIKINFGSVSGTVCVTAGNSCGTSLSNYIPVNVDPNPSLGTIGTITGLSAVCGNLSGVIYTVPAVAGATAYSWTVPANASITAGKDTNSITVTFGTTSGNICVNASNSCSSTSKHCKAVSISATAPPIPSGITGLTTVCNGQPSVNYFITPVQNATVYTWTSPAGTLITTGQGTTAIKVNFGSASGNICVTAGNACGTSLANCQTIFVDPSPALGTLGTISGPTAVCASQTDVIYSIPAVGGAATYNWSVPAGANITAGQGTNIITVHFGTNAGDVCVYASNSCSSSSPACIPISMFQGIPAIPGGINGLVKVCNGQAGEVYSISAVPNTSVYTWTVPVGATITAGQGTNTITVTFGNVSGNICVTTGNACGTSIASCRAITVSPSGVVGSIGAISGSIAVCANQSMIAFSTIPVTNATTYDWIIPTGASITAGQGTPTIKVTFGSTSGNICVNASNSCNSTSPSCIDVKVSSIAPAIPGGITGNTSVCSGQTRAKYTIAPVTNATNYIWTVPTGSSITAGQGTTAATITFGNVSGNICVTASNACGTSLSNCQAITVDPNPAIGTISTISGPDATCANLTNVIYSIPPVANAVTYTWIVPAAATITSGQGTNTITVAFGNVSGNVCVSASNSCGSSPQSYKAVTVSPNGPAIPTGITGATTVCSTQVGDYSVDPIATALSYAWTVPSGATIYSGLGKSNVKIAFGTISGPVCVSAVNGCGPSLQSCKSITVSASVLTISVTPTNASSSSNCDGSATVTPTGGTGPYSYTWTPSGNTAQTATGLCVGSYTACVTDAGGCITCSSVIISSPTGITALPDNATIRLFPNPANDHLFIEGTLSSPSNLHISIANMFAQKVVDQSIYVDGIFSQKINMEGIPSGVYFIEIRSGEMLQNIKIIKIH